MGVHLFHDNPSLHRPILSYFELNDHLRMAWTIGISGPKISKEPSISPKTLYD